MFGLQVCFGAFALIDALCMGQTKMRKLLLSVVALSTTLITSCSLSETSCSDEDAKVALEAAIRKGLENVSMERAADDDGDLLIGASAIRASISNLKLIIDDIRTTKKDPDSTKRFCTGNLKIVFSPETFASANSARELVGLPKLDAAIDRADLEKGVDYLKGSLDYSVQPTDDRKKVFAEFDGESNKLDIFGEVVAASLLKTKIETKVRLQKEEEEFARKQEEEAVQNKLNADLEAAMALRKASNEAIGVVWNSIQSEVRQQLLPQQRAWIKQKDAGCRVEGLQESTNSIEQRTVEAYCQARLNNERTNQLRQYTYYEGSY